MKLLIEKFKRSFTTLASLKVILDDYQKQFEAGEAYAGMSMREISAAYRSYKEQFRRRENFAASYVQRHCKAGDLFVEENNRYKIRPELVQGESDAAIADYQAAIFNFLALETDRLVERNIEIERLILENDSKATFAFIHSLYESEDFRNYGQLFEIVSYAILKMYFEHFGFILNRFSTTFSNDGGMDFIASAGIYQVTTQVNDKKVIGDLCKQKGTKKVLVFSKLTDKQFQHYLAQDGVTDIITGQDLKTHFLGWLSSREAFKPTIYRVLEVIQQEFKREL